MLSLCLQDDDIADVEKIVAELSRRYGSVELPEFHRESRIYADELPRSLRRVVHEFRSTEAHGALLLSGLPVDDDKLGPTPSDWRDRPATSPSLAQDIVFFLIASLLGEPIGWAGRRRGEIMRDEFPIRRFEQDRSDWGSAEPVDWHTEDADHPLRADYVGLMCLRDPDGVQTTLADVPGIGIADIDPRTRRILSERRFYIPSDHADHRPVTAAEADDPRLAGVLRRSRERRRRGIDFPEPVAVLFGAPDSPYLRIDPYRMKFVQGDEEQAALDVLTAAIDAALTGVALRPGDICFIDNYRAVHGRRAFRARHDGTDRWLRRLSVASDLRRSRELRLSAESRVLH